MADYSKGSMELTKLNNVTIQNGMVCIPIHDNSIAEKEGRAWLNFFVNEKDSEYSTHFLKLSHNKVNGDNLKAKGKDVQQKYTPIFGNLSMAQTVAPQAAVEDDPFETKKTITPPEQVKPNAPTAPPIDDLPF